MDEDIEALWLDRELHSVMGSVFDDLMWASSESQDVAFDGVDGPPDPDGRVARVVIREPSDRVLQTVHYFNVGTVLQTAGAGRRLVLGPASFVDACPLQTAIDASETYAAIVRIVLGDADGVVEVLVMQGADAAKEDATTKG